MTPDDRALDALLDSVARGRAVDWAAAEAGTSGAHQRSRLRALREVERIAEFHRTLQRSAPSEPAREGGHWGELLLLERVGRGASGEVYRAWDPALQREVALKLLRPRDGASRADLLEEARALARVRDPHVVAVHGAGEHDGVAGLWMEFLDGPTLEEEIARRGPFPADEVARLGVELGRALAAVHGAGALHRDVKPANVIRERDGRAVLMDFGLGQRRGARGDPGPYSGTPMFMSPQRLAGAPAAASDDLYALGATLRCALTGVPPFRARTLEELRTAAAAGAAERLGTRRRDAPAALVAAIERAMNPDPARRFESAVALVEAFERAAGAPPRRRRPARAAAMAGAALVALALAWALAARWNHRAPAAVAPRPPAPPQAAATAPYDVGATFLERGARGDRRLGSGDRVGPGDRLSLEFRATRPMYVYVLDADERGECYLLFPQPLFDLANPVPADSTIVLPGTRGGRENAWTVTSRGGQEHLLVVASPTRVPELEAELTHLAAPRPGRTIEYARIASGTVERLRGIGGVSELPGTTAGRPAPIFERIRALAGREQGVRGTWMRQVTLENPLR